MKQSRPITRKEYALGILYFAGTILGTAFLIFCIGSMAAYIKNAAN